VESRHGIGADAGGYTADQYREVLVIGYRAKPESVARLREIVARNPALSHVQFECAAMKADGQIDILPD
jgi:hypothetical protein